MTQTTPEQARQLAKQLSEIVYREDEHHVLLWNCCEQSANFLRSLADQLERLEAERDSLKATLYHYTEALWKATGDDENMVNAYLESTK